MRHEFRSASAFILFLIFPSAVTADCVEYENYIKWAGQNPVIGTSLYEKDIVISGTVAYIAAGNSRKLQVVNISNPSAPQLLGSVNVAALGNVATGVAIQGSIAYVTASQTGFAIVDVSNPAAPTVLKTVDTPGVAEDVVISGSYAYVADYSSGLQVINISNPATASIVATVDTPGNAFGVSLNGSVLYLADEYFGLQVINIANPLAPVIIGTKDTPGNAQDLRSIGSMVYVADSQSGIQVINASTPNSPTIVGTVDTPGNAYDLVVLGNDAYVADGTLGLQVIDISNPSAPFIVCHKSAPGTARAVAVSGSFAFLVENAAFQNGQEYGLQVIDISHLASPPMQGHLTLPTGQADGLTVSGPWAYVVTGSNDGTQGYLTVIDVSNPASPALSGTATLPGYAYDVVVSGTTAYVAYIRFTPPIGPNYGGFAVVDVSNPASPQVQGHVEPNNNSFGFNRVAVSGATAFFGDSGTFYIIDVSDPNNPVIAGTLSSLGLIRGIAISGTEAYVASSQSNNTVLYKLNISNPAAPSVRGSLTISNFYSGRLTLSDGLVYIPVYAASAGIGGFRVASVSAPGAPTLVGSFDFADRTESLAVSGGVLYAAAELGGLQVVDVSNPAQPELLGGPDVDVYAPQVALAGSWVYVTTAPLGLSVFPQECVAGTGIGPSEGNGIGAKLDLAYPNPTLAGSTTIPFTMPARGRAKLRILDLSGREVRMLADQVFDAGARSVTWDGRNDNGQLVPGGIYFYQFQGPGSELTRKLVRIR